MRAPTGAGDRGSKSRASPGSAGARSPGALRGAEGTQGRPRAAEADSALSKRDLCLPGSTYARPGPATLTDVGAPLRPGGLPAPRTPLPPQAAPAPDGSRPSRPLAAVNGRRARGGSPLLTGPAAPPRPAATAGRRLEEGRLQGLWQPGPPLERGRGEGLLRPLLARRCQEEAFHRSLG